ncbi:MAG: TIGR02757 family protein [Terrimonas sp.]|nr:TIGR02757 family protein [Terrimonas sp.]
MPSGKNERDIRLQSLLEEKVRAYNRVSFIEKDPVSIPHLFSRKQDIEIAGFFAAIFAWGARPTIINKSKELMHLMDGHPYQFITQHQEKDLKKVLHFKHRTFNSTDLLYFISFLQQHFRIHDSLESAFTNWMSAKDKNIETALNGFYQYFFSLDDVPARTRKHIASPGKGSTCKRLNMFLRWMVRKDNKGVDFGIWKNIQPSQLICPIDLHVARVARSLGLIRREQTDWQTALELTAGLRKLDPVDPVKYDFALFGMGALEPGFIRSKKEILGN